MLISAAVTCLCIAPISNARDHNERRDHNQHREHNERREHNQHREHKESVSHGYNTHRNYKRRFFASHQHREHWEHREPFHYRSFRYEHDDDNAALIGGAILGAIVISNLQHPHAAPEPVTIIQPSSPALIYRQLADGSCYRVSYDDNGTEYMQRVYTGFCGAHP